MRRKPTTDTTTAIKVVVGRFALGCPSFPTKELRDQSSLAKKVDQPERLIHFFLQVKIDHVPSIGAGGLPCVLVDSRAVVPVLPLVELVVAVVPVLPVVPVVSLAAS